MHKEQENTPKLRFPGFTGSWEQRKLEDISEFITKGATPTTYGFEWVSEGIPFFRNDAIKDNLFVYGDFSYISEEANEALKRSEIKGDDILIAITGDIGKVGIVPKTIEKANINQHTARIRIAGEEVPYFIYQSLATNKQQKEYHKIKTGLSMPQLSLEQIRDTKIFCPSTQEQKRIGDFFSNLNDLITLHQRKLAQIKEYKRGILPKMFPKDGEKVPELRFPGFTGDWEQRKLGDITSIAKGEQINKSDLTDCGEYYVLNGGMTPSGYTDSFNTKAGTISISEGGNSCGYVAYNACEFWSGGHNYTLLKPTINTKFLYQCLKAQEPNIMALRVGSGLPNIQKKSLSDVLISFPSIDEQCKIGEFLTHLDNTITLHQRKLEAMKDYKKGLLQQMFV